MSKDDYGKKTAERIFSKRDKYEAQGFADKDYQFNFDDKTVKIWLPTSVFAQQALLTLGDKVINDRSESFEEEIKMTERYYKTVCTHMQINGEAINPEKLELANLQAYALVYWTELLCPLSHWSDARAKKATLSSND